MAWALASTDVWRVLMDTTRESKVAYKAALAALLTVLSPMASTRGEGDGAAAEGGAAAGVGEGARDELDRLDRDTRLSMTSRDRVGAPRLRSS